MMRKFFHLQLMTSMLCLSAIAMRSSRDSRALGYVPPFLPGLNRVTIKPNIRYEELVLDETRLEHNKPQPQQNSLDWNDKDAGYYSSKMYPERRKGAVKPVAIFPEASPTVPYY